jgi:hypothetical protein
MIGMDSKCQIFDTILACHDLLTAGKTSRALLALLKACPKSASALQQIFQGVCRSSCPSTVMGETIAYTRINAAVIAVCTTWLLARRRVYKR